MAPVGASSTPLEDVDNTRLSQGGDVIAQERLYYSANIANNLGDVDLPSRVKEEIPATAWEYSCSVIPQCTNWTRYVAFMRIIIIGTIAEFRGELVNVVENDDILGYDLQEVLDTLFECTPVHIAMAREFRYYLLVSSHKSCQTASVLFNRYTVSPPRGPYQYFRMRGADALPRFTIAAALACSVMDDFWLTDEQFDIIAEIGNAMYNAIAFWKHHAEGDTNNLFAYLPDDERINAYRRCREAVWALDVAWSASPAMRIVANFLGLFGGPIQMMIRRYRFVEESLTLGKRETEHIIDQTRRNYKLWNRVDKQETASIEDDESLNQYSHIFGNTNALFFATLAEMLEENAEKPQVGCKMAH
ncbi:hypothetical protein E8E11_002704 [Didymella keratinophila]|nr:hypothetical protein E8E11_002704 [Didymella keratinophila]